MKVFGIGFHKTGTTTLEKCLVALGFRPQAAWANSHFLIPRWAAGEYGIILQYAQQFKSFSDSPWNHSDFYKTLDQHFSNSKFILTERDPASWFRSLRHWATPPGQKQSSIKSLPHGPEFHKLIFGMTENCFDDFEDHYRHIYEQRNFAIKNYFKDRPDDLLILDWTKHGWEELCNFLNKEVPECPLPHENKGRY